MASTTASAIRPSLRDNRQPSGSPHTPTSRFISSTYSSPGSTFRQEEDAVIIELDPRGLSAGFEGESGPQCFIPFCPDGARRVGDYRQWLPGYKCSNATLAETVSGYELWRNDLGLDGNALDLGLLEDRLERAVREAYNTYLLTDVGVARLVLVLPSLVPHPVLSTIITLLFERWKYASIALLPKPTMCLAAAGIRSGIVIDFGWEETSVTPIYEYRELQSMRSTRSMKHLTLRVGEWLRAIAEQQTVAGGQTLTCDFDFVEDTISRIATCATSNRDDQTPSEEMQQLSLAESEVQDAINLDWPTTTSTQSVPVPRSELSRLVNECFFGLPNQDSPDDEELPLGRLLYHKLLQLPADVRGLCISRLMFVGQGAPIPGLKQETIAQLKAHIKAHGWTPVRGTHVQKQRKGLVEMAQARTTPVDVRFDTVPPAGKDYVEEKLQKQKAKEAQQQDVQGHVRVIDSLGAWAGASLLASLKVKGVVEIERNKFLDHGLAGASREVDVSVVPQQRMSTLGIGAAKGSDRTSWTLGSWG
ncbi:uncharacterized protein HMPREF1541_01225 [Cyphellophora europaea CBS 101466]|uniref:Actin-related protein RO7 n=1 Tax=Cyphellophora europaea (strain CBS 101466) TaxID=1220924 RepID=W2SEI5_CYPE1|nr:uncharacterized protein HMPREF1541_01225 [Cyphellophora europaea CBS 101466]ETN47035.1 hypothetical protein HMPREF1541_01225 [Cyphellophora europaea CBS 101466]